MFDGLPAREGEMADGGARRTCAREDGRGGLAFGLEHAAVFMQPAHHNGLVVRVRTRLGISLRTDLRDILHPEQLAALGLLGGLVVVGF